jgi:hypothetical protein
MSTTGRRGVFQLMNLKSSLGILLLLQTVITGALWFHYPILLLSFFIASCLYAIDQNSDFDQEWIAVGLGALLLTWLLAFFIIGG